MALKYFSIFIIIFYCFIINSQNLINGEKCTDNYGIDELQKLLEKTKEALNHTETVLQQLSSKTQTKNKTCPENSKKTIEHMENYIGTPWQKCGACICYAKTLCSNISSCFGSSDNCANTITQNYWKSAKSPSIYPDMEEQESYKACMENENCILNTIKRYTDSFGEKDCNDDGKFDCYDKFLIHLNGENCSKYYSELPKHYKNFYYCENRYGKQPMR